MGQRNEEKQQRDPQDCSAVEDWGINFRLLSGPARLVLSLFLRSPPWARALKKKVFCEIQAEVRIVPKTFTFF